MRQMITILKRRTYDCNTGIGTDPDVPFDILIDSTDLVIDNRVSGIILPKETHSPSQNTLAPLDNVPTHNLPLLSTNKEVIDSFSNKFQQVPFE